MSILSTPSGDIGALKSEEHRPTRASRIFRRVVVLGLPALVALGVARSTISAFQDPYQQEDWHSVLVFGGWALIAVILAPIWPRTALWVMLLGAVAQLVGPLPPLVEDSVRLDYLLWTLAAIFLAVAARDSATRGRWSIIILSVLTGVLYAVLPVLSTLGVGSGQSREKSFAVMADTGVESERLTDYVDLLQVGTFILAQLVFLAIVGTSAFLLGHAVRQAWLSPAMRRRVHTGAIYSRWIALRAVPFLAVISAVHLVPMFLPQLGFDNGHQITHLAPDGSALPTPDSLLPWLIIGGSVLVAIFLAERRPTVAMWIVAAGACAQMLGFVVPIALSAQFLLYLIWVCVVIFIAVAAQSESARFPRTVIVLGVVAALALAVSRSYPLTFSFAHGFQPYFSDVQPGIWYTAIQSQVDGPTVLSMVLTEFYIVLCAGALAFLLGRLARNSWAFLGTRRDLALAQVHLEEAAQKHALVDERRLIASDVHDILAHSLTVIVAQAEGALVSAEGEREAALRRIVGVSRGSLRDVRSLIERLDGEGEPGEDTPQPGLDEVPALIETMQSAGIDVSFTVTGQAVELGESAQLAAYRIVQEALTNVLKHGDHAVPALVSWEWDRVPAGQTPDRGGVRGLHIQVDSAMAPIPSELRGGFGLEGVRVRADMVGGWVIAAPLEAVETGHAPSPGAVPGARWRLTAFIPAIAVVATAEVPA